MKSPFPGMDPYLERYWRDLHQSLIIYTRDELQDRLPPQLRARIEERVYLRRLRQGTQSLSRCVCCRIPPCAGWGRNDAGCGQCCRGGESRHTINDEPITESFIGDP